MANACCPDWHDMRRVVPVTASAVLTPVHSNRPCLNLTDED